MAVVLACLLEREQGNVFAGTWLAPIAVFLGIGQPALGVFLAWVPFDQIVHR